MAAKIDSNLKMIVDVLRTADCIDSIVSGALKPYKITHTQYNILRVLRGAQPHPLFVGELKNRLLFMNSDVTRLLDRMIKRGIIERKICSENRRKIEITINNNGLDLLLECTPVIEKVLHNFLKDEIPEQEAIMVSNTLEKIKNGILKS